MNARAMVAVVLSGAAFAPVPRQLPPAAQPVFRTRVDAVTVDVSVRSAERPVSGLTAADFRLLDSGVLQQIEVETIEAIPVDVSIVVDTSYSVVANLEKFRRDVRKFPDLLRPIDSVRLMTFTYGVDELLPMQPRPKTLAVDRIVAGGGTSLNDALFFALLPVTPPGRRHLVIVLTDGVDSTSAIDAADVPAIALRSGAMVHVVLRRLPDAVGKPPATASEVAIHAASAQTGGRVWELSSTDEIAGMLTQVFAHFRQNYVLSFVPKGVPRDGWHELTVEVPGLPGAKIVARKGYYGG